MCNTLRMLLVGMALSLSVSAFAAQVWIADWKEAFPLNMQHNGAASVIVGDRIYLIGGGNAFGSMKYAEYTQIQKDGSLAPWKLGSKLNEERIYMEAVVHGDSIYVVGGANGPDNMNFLRTVERARILPDGTLGSWEKEKNEMVVARRCTKLIATDKALYAFGGRGGGVLLDSVESAEWQPDGSLGEWHLDLQSLTTPRYITTVQKVGDTFFVIGGHRDDGNSLAEVEWSRPIADGSLQKWQAATPMRQARWGLTSAVLGDDIYALGGLYGAKFLDSIEHTKVGKDGQLGQWQSTIPLDQPRGTFSASAYNDSIYVMGGADAEGYLSSVVYAKRNAAGDLGYWGSEEEAAEVQARRAKQKEVSLKARLPNEGVVKNIFQTTAYTYVQVESGRFGLVWLAGPKIDNLKPGDHLGFSDGTSLRNFSSKELQRTFSMVILVSNMQIQSAGLPELGVLESR